MRAVVLSLGLIRLHAASCYQVPAYRSGLHRARHGAVAARLPEPVQKILPAAALKDTATVLPLWKALRQCYPTEEAAIDALRLNPAVMAPLKTLTGLARSHSSAPAHRSCACHGSPPSARLRGHTQ